MKIKAIVYILLPLLLVPGCALLQNTSRYTDENKLHSEDKYHANSLTDAEGSKDSVSLTLSKEELQNTYSIRLWPKGKISYSPELGLAGDFDSVQVSGKYQKHTAGLGKTQVKLANKIHLKQDAKQQVSIRKSDKTVSVKRLASWKLICVTAVFTLIALFYVRKRLFN